MDLDIPKRTFSTIAQCSSPPLRARWSPTFEYIKVISPRPQVMLPKIPTRPFFTTSIKRESSITELSEQQ